MAIPMSANEQIALFNKWKIPYREYSNWRTHNRNHKGNWGPVNGLMVHHTGSDAKDQRKLLHDGLSDLPGPLVQWGLDQKGVIHLIGNGRCNHAGLGDPDVLNAVIAENYTTKPPTDNQAVVDGNARFYGVEIWYSGSHEMTDAQVCSHHKWTSRSVIGHGEWQPGKWDPGYKKGTMMNMTNVRKDIAITQKLGPNPAGKGIPPVDKPPVVPPVATKPKPEVVTLKQVFDNTEEILKLLKGK